ncbi:MAG: tetratricopeptide repeat protein [Candidatus Eremiobacteraeota bacterium]|nr:tetratricopeptide repeat protein [Candidatus Eremiobacteraeota bacterium]
MATGRSNESESVAKRKARAKKADSKSLKQSGDWFQRNKSLVTWALVIAFASTCIGFGAIFYVNQLNEAEKEKKSPDVQKVDKIGENVRYWKERVQEKPNDAVSLSNLAYAYQEGVFEILAKDSGSAMAPEDKTRLDEYSKSAEEYYRKALDVDRNYVFAATNLADIYLSTGKHKEALTVLKSLLKSQGKLENDGTPAVNLDDRDTLVLMEKLCDAYVKSGDNKNAIVIGEAVLKKDQGNYNVLYYLARAYFGQKDSEKSLGLLKDALEISQAKLGMVNDPVMKGNLVKLTVEILVLQGDIYVVKKDYRKAQGSFEVSKIYVTNVLNDKGMLKGIQERLNMLAPIIAKMKPEAEPSVKPGTAPSGAPASPGVMPSGAPASPDVMPSGVPPFSPGGSPGVKPGAVQGTPPAVPSEPMAPSLPKALPSPSR